MHIATIGAWILATGLVSAKTCYNATVPVPVSARNGVFDNLSTPKNNMEATMFSIAATRQGGNFTEDALTGYATVSGHYNISAQYCMPNSSASSNSSQPVLQILTHGIGFDKTYWDLPYNNFNYSYVDYALSRGYHTLSYDRLGLGNSSHGDPKSEIQAFLEVEVLAQITRSLRNASLSGIRTRPSKIVHVGHSFGSYLTFALSATYPDLSDGLVLTGFSTNSSFTPQFVAGSNFQQARLDPSIRSRPGLNYSLGYLVTSNMGNVEYTLFDPPHYDPKILAFAEKIKQPVTVGELLTIAGLPQESKFSGPVLVMAGSNDMASCGGNCTATGGASESIPAAAKEAFPDAKTFSAYIQPNTGHGLNMHYNATGGYKQIADFLGNQGLSKNMKRLR